MIHNATYPTSDSKSLTSRSATDSFCIEFPTFKVWTISSSGASFTRLVDLFLLRTLAKERIKLDNLIAQAPFLSLHCGGWYGELWSFNVNSFFNGFKLAFLLVLLFDHLYFHFWTVQHQINSAITCCVFINQYPEFLFPHSKAVPIFKLPHCAALYHRQWGYLNSDGSHRKARLIIR